MKKYLISLLLTSTSLTVSADITKGPISKLAKHTNIYELAKSIVRFEVNDERCMGLAISDTEIMYLGEVGLIYTFVTPYSPVVEQ